MLARGAACDVAVLVEREAGGGGRLLLLARATDPGSWGPLAVIAFAVAGALTALGGLLLAPTVPVTYSSGLTITINGFAAAVFGGLASIRLASFATARR